MSPTELLYNWIPLLGATEPDAQIFSQVVSVRSPEKNLWPSGSAPQTSPSSRATSSGWTTAWEAQRRLPVDFRSVLTLPGKFSRTYDGYNKPFETYFVATGLVPRPSVAELLCLLRGSIADSKSTSLSSETKHHGMQTWRSQQCWLRKSNAVAGQI